MAGSGDPAMMYAPRELVIRLRPGHKPNSANRHATDVQIERCSNQNLPGYFRSSSVLLRHLIESQPWKYD